MRGIGGSGNPDFNATLFGAAFKIARTATEYEAMAVAASSMAAFKPMDELEGMIAVQAGARHMTAMKCFRQAALSNQPADIATKLRRDGANMARGMVDMLDALDRKRVNGSDRLSEWSVWWSTRGGRPLLATCSPRSLSDDVRG